MKAQKIKLLGHIRRMDQASPTMKLLDWKPMGTGPVGRPRQRWQEDVMEGLEKLRVKSWKETAKGRRTGRENWLRGRKPSKVVVPSDEDDDDDDGDDDDDDDVI